MFFVWLAVFTLSLIFLVKSADYLVDSAKQIGLHFSIPRFIIGALIVGIGTSAPELASSIAAVFQGAPEMVVANAIGSNIANVFLIVGITALFAKNIKVTKQLIDIDIPLLLLSVSLFSLIIFDKVVDFYDALFLLAGLLFYLTYVIASKEKMNSEESLNINLKKEFLILIASLVVLAFSAKYLVLSVLKLATILGVSVSVITLIAVAIGTSLPELFVSIASVKKGEADMALGNIFGSNIFNILAVSGIPALFANLPVDGKTFSFAFPILVLSTILFAFSGISKRIHAFEGVFFLIIYAYFVLRLFL